MIDDGMMGGGQPPPYPGAFAALQSEVEQYVGQAELSDLLGLDGEADTALVEAEFSGQPVPLGQLAGGIGIGMGMGMAAPADPLADPMNNDSVRQDMIDLLQQRAQARATASEKFQAKARGMMGGPSGGGY